MRLAMVLVLGLVVGPRAVRADGAFPADLQVFEPLDAPARTVLATNYGLILTDDDGQHWSFICEPAISPQQVTRYALGADGTIYAASGSHVLHSSDRGCTWSASALGAQADQVSDLFADPVDPARVYALVYRGATFSLVISQDHAQSFGPPSLSGSLLLGVEAARSQPSRVYASGFTALDGGTAIPVLWTSDDRGISFSAQPLTSVGSVYPFIAAVDPADPDAVFLNLNQAGKPDRLAMTHDRGQTVRVLLAAPTNFSAFAVDADHTAYVADRNHHLWRFEPDGGMASLAGPSATCLAVRGGVVDACGSINSDVFVLGRSTDRGATFSPRVTTKSYSTLDCPAVLQVCGQVNPSPVTSSSTTGSSSGGGKHGCGCEAGDDAAALCAAFAIALGRARRSRRSPAAPRARSGFPRDR